MAEEASARLDLVERELGDLRRAADQGRLAAEILATSSWIRRAHVPAKLMASVVIATRDRHELLERAVESVLEQTYEHLELVVVDDAGSDESWTWLQRHPDPRLRPIRLDERAGANAARNRGRAELKGDFACYLDDDNVMDPDWLRSVAWALSEQPEVSFVYGARVIDNLSRHTRTGEASPLPWIQLLDWDAAAIREANRVDVNVLAHRLPGPLFPTEDGASHYGDWDLVLQLAEHGDPLRLPALAAYYSTAAPGRLSEDHQAMDAGWLHVREKWQHR
jgi:glycosyltransferase involved in cell wall biosynthesis